MSYKSSNSRMARLLRIFVIGYIELLSKVLRFKKQVKPKIVRLGSEYGGWDLDLISEEENIVLISGGAGEDISFEIEMISKFNCKVVLVDPTERAKLHLKEVYLSVGNNRKHEYIDGGKQPVASYDLRKINPGNLEFLNVALWSDSCGLRLVPPAEEKYVSFRLPKSKSEHLTATSFQSTTIDLIISRFYQLFDSKTSLIVKLDIEGSEVEVLKHMVSISIQPSQILVEFDILRYATISDAFRCIALSTQLAFLDYIPISIRGLCVNFAKGRT